MTWKDKLFLEVFLLVVLLLIAMVIVGFNMPPAESVYIPRSELNELF